MGGTMKNANLSFDISRSKNKKEKAAGDQPGSRSALESHQVFLHISLWWSPSAQGKSQRAPIKMIINSTRRKDERTDTVLFPPPWDVVLIDKEELW